MNVRVDTYRWMVEWSDGRMVGYNGRVDKLKDGRMGKWNDDRMDIWQDDRMGRWEHGQTDIIL